GSPARSPAPRRRGPGGCDVASWVRPSDEQVLQHLERPVVRVVVAIEEVALAAREEPLADLVRGQRHRALVRAQQGLDLAQPAGGAQVEAGAARGAPGPDGAVAALGRARAAVLAVDRTQGVAVEPALDVADAPARRLEELDARIEVPLGIDGELAHA